MLPTFPFRVPDPVHGYGEPATPSRACLNIVAEGKSYPSSLSPIPSEYNSLTPRPRSSSFSPVPSSPLEDLSGLSNALPPMSSDDVIRSSPIIGNKAERTAKSIAKGRRKRERTINAQKEKAFTEELKFTQDTRRAEEEALKRKTGFFDDILHSLTIRDYTLGDLLLYVSNPIFKQGKARWESLFRDRSTIRELLNLWAYKSSAASRDQIQSWAIGYIAGEVNREAQEITASRYLQTLDRPINARTVLGFQVKDIQDHFEKHGTIFMQIFRAFATSARQLKTASTKRFTKKMTVVTSAALSLLGEYSYSNNLAKKIMGMYMYSTGSQRQPITVMSHLGISESYDAITGKKRKRKTKKKKTDVTLPVMTELSTASVDANNIILDVLHEGRGGSLRQLSDSMVDMARAIAKTGLYGTSYDNINMVFRAAEQILGRTDAQENGTCATIWPLFKATLVNMKVSDLKQAFDKAKPLSLSDLLLHHTEAHELNRNMVHCILRIIITHGGEGFQKFKPDLERTTPHTKYKIELHRTPLHPLPAFDIDESTIVGGAQVTDTIHDLLWVKKVPGWFDTVKFFCGDQLTIARLRSLVNIRAGHEGGYTGFGWGVWIPGLFHAKMADVHGFFITHWGSAAAGSRNAGCLAFHNTVIQRKPIVLTSLPPFRTCRDLIFVSLYARVLHCLLLVSKTMSLAECSADLTWSSLECYAQNIQDQFANPDHVADLRYRRKCAQGVPVNPGEPPIRDGDMIFENAILFLRDALLSREFSDAVKIGDSGRVVLVLKTWALSFRGSGRSKYAHEMLHLIHNLTCVWPEAIRDIVFNNWLVNPTGNPYSWVEVDLMQEHMNFWIKNFYRAHGSSASWEWLEMIAPCVNVLRQLAMNFKQMLGTDMGTAHHPMDLTCDLPDLMDSLEEHEVYMYKRGRYLDKDDIPVRDTVSIGLNELISGRSNPLMDYNSAFLRLQARRQLTPLVGTEQPKLAPSPSIPPPIQPSPPDTDAIHTDNICITANTSDSEESDNDEATEELGEYLQGFEEYSDQEATLQLESAADVSLEMDVEDLRFTGRGDAESESDEEMTDNDEESLKSDKEGEE